MDTYTIGQMAKQTGLSIHTLRYYEKEGILLPIERDEHGNRVFQEKDVVWLEAVSCLRSSGMPIKDIKLYIALHQKGPEMILEKRQVFVDLRKKLVKQIEDLQNYVDMIDCNLDYIDSGKLTGL